MSVRKLHISNELSLPIDAVTCEPSPLNKLRISETLSLHCITHANISNVVDQICCDHIGIAWELSQEDVKAVQDRLWSRIIIGAKEECWPWTGSLTTDRYGQAKVAGRLVLASRLIFLLIHGYLPPVVMHDCDNPPCCNPAHLLPGTKQSNNDDKMRKGRHVPSFGDANGARKHPERIARGDAHHARKYPENMARGEKHPCCRISDASVIEMRKLYDSGSSTQAELAKRYGIGPSQAHRIIHLVSRV